MDQVIVVPGSEVPERQRVARDTFIRTVVQSRGTPDWVIAPEMLNRWWPRANEATPLESLIEAHE